MTILQKLKIKFFENLINIKNINCYSNEGNIWRKSDIKFVNKNELMILLKEKFISERGRINCSLWEQGGKWRWLGIQYVIKGILKTKLLIKLNLVLILLVIRLALSKSVKEFLSIISSRIAYILCLLLHA